MREKAQALLAAGDAQLAEIANQMPLANDKLVNAKASFGAKQIELTNLEADLQQQLDAKRAELTAFQADVEQQIAAKKSESAALEIDLGSARKSVDDLQAREEQLTAAVPAMATAISCYDESARVLADKYPGNDGIAAHLTAFADGLVTQYEPVIQPVIQPAIATDPTMSTVEG